MGRILANDVGVQSISIHVAENTGKSGRRRDRYNQAVKVGVFDSGLGGLAIAQAIMRLLPDYDYLYLGDTKRVPYGNRSQAAIHEFTSEALDFMFANDCQIVILACNTASAEALRKSQQEYLPNRFPDRRVLGVVIPCVEAAISCGSTRFGVLATSSTVESGAYEREFLRQSPDCVVDCVSAPLLVPLVECDGLEFAEPILAHYVAKLDPACEAILLGCTHYCWLKDQVRQLTGKQVISPDEVVPEKFADYLSRHPEHSGKLTLSRSRTYCVTDLTEGYKELASRLVDAAVPLTEVSL